MIIELADLNSLYHYKKHINDTINYLNGKLNKGLILDVGQKSPLTNAIESHFGNMVFNTTGDLDESLHIPKHKYTNIIYSHTIEHQFNPLHTLLMIKKFMNADTKLFIMLPSRGKLLWCSGHFHEIDHYRMKLLIKRAGLKITDYQRKKYWRDWWFYFTGIKSFLRLFFEYNAYYIITL